MQFSAGTIKQKGPDNIAKKQTMKSAEKSLQCVSFFSRHGINWFYELKNHMPLPEFVETNAHATGHTSCGIMSVEHIVDSFVYKIWQSASYWVLWVSLLKAV